MIDSEELIIQKHDLKLKIQKQIMDQIENIKNTNDLGYTSWQVAEAVVESIRKDKEDQKIHRKKNFIDIILPKL